MLYALQMSKTHSNRAQLFHAAGQSTSDDSRLETMRTLKACVAYLHHDWSKAFLLLCDFEMGVNKPCAMYVACIPPVTLAVHVCVALAMYAP